VVESLRVAGIEASSAERRAQVAELQALLPHETRQAQPSLAAPEAAQALHLEVRAEGGAAGRQACMQIAQGTLHCAPYLAGDEGRVGYAVARCWLGEQGGEAEAEPLIAEDLWLQARWTWLLGGVTVATLIAATLVSVEAVKLEDDFAALVARGETEGVSGRQVAEASGAARRHAVAATFLWSAGAMLAVGTAWVAYQEIWASPEEAGPRPLAWQPWLSDEVLGLSWGGRF